MSTDFDCSTRLYFEPLDEEAVSAIIGAGIVPAAVEMCDQLAIEAIVKATSVDWPLDVGALLLVDIDGVAAEVEETTARARELLVAAGAVEIRAPKDEAERTLAWKGRKAAFAAMGRISPNYYVQDGVIPRKDVAAVLREIAALGAAVCLRYGGSVTGEHGVGHDKACYLGEQFSPDDLETMMLIRTAFDPERRFNPEKVFPTPRLCGDRPGVYVPHAAETRGQAGRG